MSLFFWRRKREADFDEEIQSHLEAAIRDRMERGETREEAERTARREFGNVPLIKDTTRDIWGWALLDRLAQDLRYGIRMLAKNPGFTLVAILTLALGIGANTAIFSVAEQVLLRSLPVPDPNELVLVHSPGPAPKGRVWTDRSGDSFSYSYPLYRELRQRSAETAGLLARFSVSVNISLDGQAERAGGELVSGNYFEVLRVRAAAGRVLTPEDETTPGSNPVVVLNHSYWTRRFGANPAILNRNVFINAGTFTVVGVAAPGFQGVQLDGGPDLWIPITMKAQITPNWDGLNHWDHHWVRLMGRVRSDLTRDQAAKQLTAAYRPLLEETLARTGGSGWTSEERNRFLAKPIVLLPGRSGRPIDDDARTGLLLMMGMIGLVLLVACGNLANLLLARGLARQRETAVRIALGATRGRLIRQMMTESVLLGLAGAAAGLLVAVWMLDALAARLELLSAALNLRLMVYSGGLGLLTSVLFGLMPAVRLTQTDVNATLKDQSTGATVSRAHARMRQGLVVAQMSTTLVLLVGAGLFMRTFDALARLNLGLRTDHLLILSLSPELSGYTPERTVQLLEGLREEFNALPGVASASAAVMPVLTENVTVSNITAEGHATEQGKEANVAQNWVGPGFFSTLGVPVLRGREFTGADGRQSPKVAVVNESMAREFFAGDAIGRRFAFGAGNVTPDILIVGVVPDFNHSSMREQHRPMVFQPAAQFSQLGSFTYYLRTSVPPTSAITAVRRQVERLDAKLPIFYVLPMEEQIAAQLRDERLLTMLSSCLALLAAALAALGIAGVTNYSVVRRTREIGIRMAIGASARDVLWLILREVVVMIVVGAAVGLPLAVFLARFTESLLFGVKPMDPLVLAGALLFLTGVALLMGYVPARRATKVDPMVALRYE